jgi:hypothetical protein
VEETPGAEDAPAAVAHQEDFKLNTIENKWSDLRRVQS